jgi:hypothetical protein
MGRVCSKYRENTFAYRVLVGNPEGNITQAILRGR